MRVDAKKCPLVFVEWVDSVQPKSNWERLENFRASSAVTCYSVGWLLLDGESKSLAPNIGMIQDESLQVSGVITIPKRSITRIIPLKEPTL